MSFSRNVQAQRHLRLVSVEGVSVSQSYYEPEQAGRNYTALIVCSIAVSAMVVCAGGALWLGGHVFTRIIA